MSFQDKSIECVDCGEKFVFSSREQELYATRGFTNEPKRCQTCRQARKDKRGSSTGTGLEGQAQMHTAVCAQCGQQASVPFEPRTDRPVYCSSCYSKVKLNKGR